MFFKNKNRPAIDESDDQTLIVPQGGYAVIDKGETKYTAIISPAVQSCRVMFYKSEDVLALAHIDNAPKNRGVHYSTYGF